MTTRSIFQKICPSCITTLAHDARQCACGYDFERENADAALSSEVIRLKAEELYENYLAARAQQAANAVKAAQAEFARDPANIEKSARVGSAIREAQAAEATLAAQSACIAQMKKALHPASASVPAAVALPAAPKKRATPKSAVAARAHTRLPAEAALPAAARNPATAAPASVSPEANLPPAPVQTVTPNAAFRQTQAAKAEKIPRAAQHSRSVTSVKPAKNEPVRKKDLPEIPAEVPEVKPRAAVSAPVPVKSAPRLLALPDKKECPNCTATVADNAARCRCGYEFPSSEQMIPPLLMSEEERAEFDKLFAWS